jgi:predicted DNA-binding transcriptional regulator AlpA
MTVKFLSKKQVNEKLGWSRATTDRRRRNDPKFPKARKATKHRAARCYWYEHEIDDYMGSLPAD